jgi:hypothetical protein
MTVMKRSAFIWLLFVRLALSISHGPKRRWLHAVAGRRTDGLDLPAMMPFVLTVVVRVGVGIATLDSLIVSPHVGA